MKRVLALLVVCAFAAGPFGFVGCSSEVPKDPDAAANEAKQKDLAPDPGSPDDALDGGKKLPGGKFGFGEEEKKD